MSTWQSFDRLARFYRALEFVAFGRDLERARFAHLGQLSRCKSILVLGEGDGRCLARLVTIARDAEVDCLDLSAAMLRRAALRLQGRAAATQRVSFRQADLLATPLPAARYDAVVTCFFLDCFTPPDAAQVMARIEASLRPGAKWLWSDFTLPASGPARWRARLWVGLLYLAFRWVTGLRARELPPVEKFFCDHGWKPVVDASWQWGLLRSAVFQRATPTGSEKGK